MSVYTKVVEYRFEVNGDPFYLGASHGVVLQRDYRDIRAGHHPHTEGVLVRNVTTGEWFWSEGRHVFDRYSRVTPAQILEFLNANPPPTGVE